MFSRFYNKPVYVFPPPKLMKYQSIHNHYYYFAICVILKIELLQSVQFFFGDGIPRK